MTPADAAFLLSVGVLAGFIMATVADHYRYRNRRP
jgi:hypothetical protein